MSVGYKLVNLIRRYVTTRPNLMPGHSGNLVSSLWIAIRIDNRNNHVTHERQKAPVRGC